jgi:hypothetical protein
MKQFNIEKFQDKTITIIENLLEEVPDELKSDIAGFISLQAVIFGAINMYEGVGILELAKQEYVNVCEEILSEEDEITTGLN